MKELRFKIFGRHIAVTGQAGAWRAYYFGAEGKRREADFVIPGDVAEAGLCEYLSDLFHEDATPRNNTAVQLC
ncbi:hypothetical protein SAMN05216319_1703 [Duganella sp. CF402]|uniref:DUF7661 family protein n=1 Tax=unclassified Duganella TaxID=2636909 RepID=UPI0008AC0692|nr:MULTISPECIES: hypothetical protein [unclassified Duganella]RZT09854.1 hypothetical protein EV582_1925 [Duganella sp. BK701]SEL39987.1 hypothetical protein SAMN05216319_1703 [Duganella sp. CF402]